jgi:hypothetical protein
MQEENNEIEEDKNEEGSLLEEALDRLQKNTNTKSFNKIFSSIRKQNGVKGLKRVHALDKAFDVIVDYLIPDNISSAIYKVNLTKSGESYVDIERMKKLSK